MTKSILTTRGWVGPRGLLIGAVLVAFLAGWWIRSVRADGLIDARMNYSGTIYDGETPLTGSHDVQVDFWDDPELKDADHWKCSTKSPNTAFVAGRFRVELDLPCTAAAKTIPNLWTEVSVTLPSGKTTSLGRTRVGPVPFAVQAASVPWTGVTGAPDFKSRRFGMVNLRINASNVPKKVEIASDYLDCEDQALSMLRLTADLAAVGANGLDKGEASNNAWYAIYVICGTTTPPAALLSAADLAPPDLAPPTLPSGYQKKRRIGFAYLNGSGAVDPFRVVDDVYYHLWNVDTARAQSPSKTTTGQWTALRLDPRTSPPIETQVFLSCVVKTAGGPAQAFVRPRAASDKGMGDDMTAGAFVASPGAGPGVGTTEILQNESRDIFYLVNAPFTDIHFVTIGFKIPPM